MFLWVLMPFLGINTYAGNVINSPAGNICAEISVTGEGEVQYQIFRNGKSIMPFSRLGITREDADFSTGLSLQKADEEQRIQDSYTLLHGKRKNCHYEATERTFHFTNQLGEELNLIFRVSNDGIAFRYFFPDAPEGKKVIKEENTEFVFYPRTVAYLTPLRNPRTGWCRTMPSYEEWYSFMPVGMNAPEKAGWAYPALFQIDDTWILLTEAVIEKNYCATRLRQECRQGIYKIGFPNYQEGLPGGDILPTNSSSQWYSPWRIITVGTLKTIIEGTQGTDLATAAPKKDYSWVKPGRAAWSWCYYDDGHTVYKTQKEFIDYAAEMGWEYVLVDAFWDTKIGRDRIAELADYARSKQVGILLWYNSGGPWNDTPHTPRDYMTNANIRRSEFEWLQKTGIKGIKVDFFPGDAQSTMKYYTEILEDATEYGLLVNCHGATLPRGLQRTYPNLMTMEAVWGQEMTPRGQVSADKTPNHICMLPFTRNAYDPMDFTPVFLGEYPGDAIRRTTGSSELAQAVVFLSGVQHYSEVAERMKEMPPFIIQIMKDIPNTWDETVFIDGFPGKFVTIARRSGDTWYIAGINGEEIDHELSIDLPFIKKSTPYYMITDVDNRKMKEENGIWKTGKKKIIQMQPYGGFIMKIKI